jgi:hypothetical protein
VSDRFHLKPLLRSVTFPQVAFLLALAQKSVRLLEVLPDQPPFLVDVPDLPPAPVEKRRLRQYARRIDQALRPVLNSLEVPLILAAAEPLNSSFRSVNSYPHLAPAGVPGNPETTPDADLAASARTVLDDLYADELDRIRRLYDQRSAERRALSDIAEVARAATAGVVDTVLSTSTRWCRARSTRRAAPSASAPRATRSTTASSTRSRVARGSTGAGCWRSAATTSRGTSRSRRFSATRPDG